MVEWFSIKSTEIKRIGYDFDSDTMFIDFEGSDIDYPYCDVPEELFREFLSASSAIKFYNQYIKGSYRCKNVSRLISKFLF